MGEGRRGRAGEILMLAIPGAVNASTPWCTVHGASLIRFDASARFGWGCMGCEQHRARAYWWPWSEDW